MNALRELLDWFSASALPLWASRGFHEDRAVFAERLGFDAMPLTALPHRAMVQARQIAVYCDAERAGMMPGAGDIALRAAETLIATYPGTDTGKPGTWAFSATREGAIADARADLYTHAFVLYAFARCHALTGDDAFRRHAEDTLGGIERTFALEGGGLAPAPGVAAPLLQNPVMHLFEALLALAETCGDPFRGAAAELAGFAQSAFIDPRTGALLECFEAGWKPAAAPANRVEPGHLYEWIWLLDTAERVIGLDAAARIDALYAFARAHGSDAAGFIVDELAPDGTLRAPARRLWPHTEALRAELVMARRSGDAAHRARAAKLAARLHSGFLRNAPAGGWIDRIDAQGAPLSADMPASSLYHLGGAAMAVAELAHSDGTLDGSAPMV